MLLLKSFQIPDQLSNEHFNFKVLGPEFSEVDYEAVISSKERLRHVFAENSKWPKTEMSFEANKKDLARHEKEFNTREAFAYAVLNSAKCHYLGCIYTDPTDHLDYDFELYLWGKDAKYWMKCFLAL